MESEKFSRRVLERHCVFGRVKIETRKIRKSMYTGRQTICGNLHGIDFFFPSVRADVYEKELMTMINLNPKQERFAAEFIACGNATAAYKVAYPNVGDNTARVNASRLLADKRIQVRLKELQSEMTSEKICDSIELQEFLSRVVRRELTEELYLPSGERQERANSVRDALKAAELLARISGLYVTKAEVDVQGVVPVVIHDDI